MKVQIRNNMFETNSSSAHAMLIMKKRQTMTTQEIRDEFFLDSSWQKNNILILDSFDNIFGRGFDVLSTFREKLSYALASFCGNCYTLQNYIKAGNIFEETFVPMLIELVGVDDVKIPMRIVGFHVYSDSVTDDINQSYDTYEEVPYDDLVYTGFHEEHMYDEICKSGRKQEQIWLDVPNFGEVDHQSCDLLSSFLKKYGISLKEYLIRKDIIVIIDSDEICMLNRFDESDILNKQAIQIIYPK